MAYSLAVAIQLLLSVEVDALDDLELKFIVSQVGIADHSRVGTDFVVKPRYGIPSLARVSKK